MCLKGNGPDPQVGTMAASSGDGIPGQLAVLLGHPAKRIRITAPPRISVIDLATAITSKDAHHAAQDLGFVKERHPEVTQILGDFKFRGRGQKNTPVIGIRGAVELILLLPGQQAARVRRQAAELLCRYLGGDISLVEEVCRLRGFQEELAAGAPEDPRRVFGGAVEATPSAEYLSRVYCSGYSAGR